MSQEESEATLDTGAMVPDCVRRTAVRNGVVALVAPCFPPNGVRCILVKQVLV